MISKLMLGALMWVAVVSSASAQTTAASLTGTIKDSTGSVLPGATVTIVNTATAATVWQGTTDQDRTFSRPHFRSASTA